MNTGSAEPWTPPPAPPPQPPQPQCLTWPQYPLHPLSTPSRLIDADRCTPGGLVQIETFSTRGGRWTETYYAPAAADLAVLDRLEPGCAPDRVPWERFRAELIAAPAALLRQRDWRRVPAASLLMLLERLRSHLAADEDASRGIAEPEPPPAADQQPSKAGKPRLIARRLLRETWKHYGEGAEKFPGYAALTEEGRRSFGVEIESHHFSRALKDLGDLGDTIQRWIRPPKAMPGGRPQPAPTPVEIEECQAWFRNHPAAKADGVSDLLDSQSPEFWQHMTPSPNLWERAMQELVKEASEGIH